MGKWLRAWMAALAVAVCGSTQAQVPVTVLPPELVPWMDAITKAESARKPWAVMNNTFFRRGIKPPSHFFNTRAEAEKYARERIAAGDNLDLGLNQLNWFYQKNRPGVTLDNIFDTFVQEQIGKKVLLEFYDKAVRMYGRGDLAIRRAVSAYNNGNINADNPVYLTKVYRAMGKSTEGIQTEGAPRSGSAADALSQQETSSAQAPLETTAGMSKSQAKRAEKDALLTDNTQSSAQEAQQASQSTKTAQTVGVFAGIAALLGVLLATGMLGPALLLLGKVLKVAFSAALKVLKLGRLAKNVPGSGAGDKIENQMRTGT